MASVPKTFRKIITVPEPGSGTVGKLQRLVDVPGQWVCSADIYVTLATTGLVYIGWSAGVRGIEFAAGEVTTWRSPIKETVVMRNQTVDQASSRVQNNTVESPQQFDLYNLYVDADNDRAELIVITW